MSTTVSVILLLAAAAFGVFLWVRMPQLTAARGGRVVLLLALLVMPVVLVQIGVARTLSGSKQKAFCTSCHEMQVYETSLHIDDSEYLPANHYQNRYVPRETACYTCHTDYTLYGDVSAKLNGMKHVFVHYFGDVPAPGEIALYEPYPNDNCLQCHRGARRFEKKASHTTEGVTIEMLYANQKSCMSKGCHDKVHDIDHIARRDIWGEPPFPIPDVLKQKAAEEPAAEDPFGAEDPFADEGTAKPADAPDAGSGSKPASELDNVDDLFADEDAGAAAPDAAPAPAEDAAPAAPAEDAGPVAPADDAAPAPDDAPAPPASKEDAR